LEKKRDSGPPVGGGKKKKKEGIMSNLPKRNVRIVGSSSFILGISRDSTRRGFTGKLQRQHSAGVRVAIGHGLGGGSRPLPLKNALLPVHGAGKHKGRGLTMKKKKRKITEVTKVS